MPFALEFDGFSFQLSSDDVTLGGVLQFSCGTNLDHAVLVNGFGTVGSTLWDQVRTMYGTLCYGITAESTRSDILQGRVIFVYYTYARNLSFQFYRDRILSQYTG